MAAEKFSVDADHSKVGFSVTLIGVTDVEGRFSEFSGTIMYDDADLTSLLSPPSSKRQASNTGSNFRDKDLKAAAILRCRKISHDPLSEHRYS